MEDYDCTINYHLGKANMVADVLSRQVQVAGSMIKKLHLLEEVSIWSPHLKPTKVILENIVVKSVLLDHIKEAQERTMKCKSDWRKLRKGKNQILTWERMVY